MSVPQFKSTWHRMREIVILSMNIIYIKDTLQKVERLRNTLLYMNSTDGPLDVVVLNLQTHKRALNKRVKDLIEDLINSNKTDNYVFNITLEHACLTKKELEKGYALFTNVYNSTFALNLRNGALLPITDPESSSIDRNLSSLEYTAQHDGPVYKYFDIDTADPLKNELRY